MSNDGIRATGAYVTALPFLFLMLTLSYISNVNASPIPPPLIKTNQTANANTTKVIILTGNTTKQQSAPDCKFFPNDKNCVNSSSTIPIINMTKNVTTLENKNTSLPSVAHTCPDGSVADANASCVT